MYRRLFSRHSSWNEFVARSAYVQHAHFSKDRKWIRANEGHSSFQRGREMLKADKMMQLWNHHKAFRQWTLGFRRAQRAEAVDCMRLPWSTSSCHRLLAAAADLKFCRAL
mmetsp:Transcript_122482/g.183146  ORF Transcript_122482/g.183146 Transcript_122482/m.183146 type:complete len:110 (-) Transcript_122482:426-755(-)